MRNILTAVLLLAFFVVLLIFAMFILDSKRAGAQGFHGDGHDKMHHWYRTLKRPGTNYSCCNENDCRPTDARILEDGTIQAMKDGRWITIPKDRILNVNPPDLNSHICAPPSGSAFWDPDHVYCFVFGAGV